MRPYRVKHRQAAGVIALPSASRDASDGWTVRGPHADPGVTDLLIVHLRDHRSSHSIAIVCTISVPTAASSV